MAVLVAPGDVDLRRVGSGGLIYSLDLLANYAAGLGLGQRRPRQEIPDDVLLGEPVADVSLLVSADRTVAALRAELRIETQPPQCLQIALTVMNRDDDRGRGP